MNIVDIVKIKYPQAILNGQVSFRLLEDGSINIVNWDVPGVDRPLESDLLQEADSLHNQYMRLQLEERATPLLLQIIENTAKSKGYESSLSCASYINSTNAQWQSEASTFISWRDSCYQYAYQVLNDVESGASIPEEQEFINGIPVILWP